jgi:glycine/serine hydroxymethyltransferase
MHASKISEVEGLIRQQDEWRNRCINLIASENVNRFRSAYQQVRYSYDPSE